MSHRNAIENLICEFSHERFDFMKQESQTIPYTLILSSRYIVRSGVSGFYCYAIYERPPASPAFDLAQTRMVFKLERDR